MLKTSENQSITNMERIQSRRGIAQDGYFQTFEIFKNFH